MKVKSFQLGLATQVFKAFSDEARVRILHQLHLHGELCITDLEQVLNFTQSKTSRHLTYLKAAGLVISHREDLYVFYGLNASAMQVVQHLFRFLQNDPILAQDEQSFKVLYSNRELVASRKNLARMAQDPRRAE